MTVAGKNLGSAEAVGQDARPLRASVVLATYNRLDPLRLLLDDLATQTVDPAAFEVIVVDDGSAEPVRPRIDVSRYPFALTVMEQANAGPAAARHRGVLRARGDVLVLIDDDMRLPPQFLGEHLRHHGQGRRVAVLGRCRSDPNIEHKPIFERYFGLKWEQLSRGVASGRVRVDGTMLATGNVSMLRADYLRSGGLDLSLRRAEDIALGLALEEIGVEFVFTEAAYAIHASDHTEPEKFRGRMYVHGKLETIIAERHPNMLHADPWRHAFSLPLLGRVLCLPSFVAPRASERIADFVLSTALGADRIGFERLALRGVGLVYGLEYFRGMRDQAGSFGGLLRSCGRFLDKAAGADRPVAGLASGVTRAVRALLRRRPS